MNDPVYVNSLYDAAGLGIASGAVSGLGFVLKSARPYARKLAGGLCLWMGSISLMAPIAFAVYIHHVLTWHPPLKSEPHGLAALCGVFLPMWVSGLIPLQMSFELLSFPSWKRIVALLGDALKSTLLPWCEKPLFVYQMRSALTEEQFLSRLEQVADVARNSRHRMWLAFPLRDSRDVIAMPKANRIILMRSNVRYAYEIQIEFIKDKAPVCLELRSELITYIKLFMGMYFVLLCVMSVCAIGGVVISVLTGGEQLKSLLIIPGFASFWYVVLSFMRCHRWGGWKQEQYIVAWLKRNFDMEVIDSQPARKRYFFF